MRERITLIHSPDRGIDPSTFELSSTGLRTPALESVREDRLTLALDALPAEVAQLLQDFEQLTVRWAGEEAYGVLEPFSSRLSPGLHVWYTPAKGLALNHINFVAFWAFTTAEDKHPSGSSTHYFYQTLPSMSRLTTFLQDDICGSDKACFSRIPDLSTAANLDFTFDASTDVSKLTAFWGLQSQSLNLQVNHGRRTEVGILAKGSPPNMGEHDVGMSGILTVLGESKTPSPTLFSFPSRHRASEGRFSTQFQSPTGLHPTLQLSMDTNGSPGEECRPYTYLTLPKAIFADRYQLDDDLFLASKGLAASRYSSFPVDLEAPAYATTTWGSNVLLELASPPNTSEAWTAEVPLHLRYLQSSSIGEQEVSVPYPVVFWACPADGDVDFTNNPFDRTHLGYDALFPKDTTFWHVEPEPVDGSRLVNTVNVPVLKTGNEDLIRQGTFAVLGAGALWILIVVIRTFRLTRQEGQSEASKKTQ